MWLSTLGFDAGRFPRPLSFISINWRGRPLTDYQVIVETIGGTRARTGLTVEAVLDTGEYPVGVKISDAEMKTIPISRHDFHGEWNYFIHSAPIPESVQDKTISPEGTK